MPFRPAPTVAFVIMLLAIVPSASIGQARAPGCTIHVEPGIGPVCDAGTRWEVFAPDGHSLGFVHKATDAFSAAAGGSSHNGQSAASTTSGPPGYSTSPPPPTYVPSGKPWKGVTCVTPDADGGQSYFAAVYAVASNDQDKYGPALVQSIRAIVDLMDRTVQQAAEQTGGDADFRFLCKNGKVAVAHAVLPITSSQATFSSIAGALQALGFNDDDPQSPTYNITYDRDNVRYAVFYDESLYTNPNIQGQGTWYDDDRHEANWNMGDHGQLAMSYMDIYVSPQPAPQYADVMLHEMTHTMGGVQDSAPHSTGAGHCTDDYDTMCYFDGGPWAGAYTTSACMLTQVGSTSTEPYDCGHDDYFAATTFPKTYLDCYWDVGSTLNPFLDTHDTPATSPARVLQIPDSPRYLSSVLGATGESISWVGPEAPNCAHDGYLLERQVGTTASWKVIHDTDGHRVQTVRAPNPLGPLAWDLYPCDSHMVRVRAYNSLGLGYVSAPAGSPTNEPGGITDPPRTSSTTVGPGMQVTLTWDPPYSPCSLLRYEISRDGVWVANLAPGAGPPYGPVSYPDTVPFGCTEYMYAARAVDGYGASPPAAIPVNLRLAPAAVPTLASSPTIQAILPSATLTSITSATVLERLEWTPPPSNGCPVNGYRVQAQAIATVGSSTAATPWTTILNLGSSTMSADVPGDSCIAWRVLAYNQYGDGEPSPTLRHCLVQGF